MRVFDELLKQILVSLAFLLTISTSAMAQESEAESSAMDQYNYHWAPLALLEWHTPVVRLGVEYIPAKWNGEWGVQTDAGLNIRMSGLRGKDDQLSDNWAGELRLEGRHYPKIQEGNELYHALELFYIYNSFSEELGSFKEDGVTTHFEKADVRVNTTGFHFKVGKKYRIDENLFVDGYFGLGGRLLNVKHHEVVRLYADDVAAYTHSPWLGISNMEGLSPRISVAAGVLIGFSL